MKTVEELRSESENYRKLLEQARSWLENFKARIDELEEKCDSYASCVQAQDEQILRLQKQVCQMHSESGEIASVQDADLPQVEIENRRLRQRLSDLNEYLKTTRCDGMKFYL
tara:strand:+ start:538 stop:873 length:336 start_codon:yes stop_codon:yes gene_type:complete